jgi:hypothetical protein
MERVSESLSPRSSFTSAFYKDFISWLKGSWLCLGSIGPFGDGCHHQSMCSRGRLCMPLFLSLSE